tara:strand:- start:283 stop:1413 length:1131 start_codon:yes stop_codon:yes gene_type:complete
MLNNRQNNYFDKIYIGTGPILIFDAINEKLKGKNILMIDSKSKIGGAWKLIDLYGLNDLENAVHYLIPNEVGYNFLEENLKIKLSRNEKKFYALKFFSHPIILSSSSIFGRLFSSFKNQLSADKISIFRLFMNIFRKTSYSNSKYPSKGCRVLLEKMENLIGIVNLNIKLNTLVEDIEIIDLDYSKINTSKGDFYFKKLVLSHGFLPPKNINIYGKKISLEKKTHRRPSLHIVYSSKNELLKRRTMSFSQVLFDNESNIKYVHDLTQYINKSSSQRNMYALVLALKHHMKDCSETYQLVRKELEEFNLIPKSQYLNKVLYYWQDIVLPVLYTDDLKYLEKKSCGNIEIMLTEELNSGFGMYSERWIFLKELLGRIY